MNLSLRLSSTAPAIQVKVRLSEEKKLPKEQVKKVVAKEKEVVPAPAVAEGKLDLG